MRFLPTGTQMKEADRYTIQEVGIPSAVLMERAALETLRLLRREGLDTRRTLVVCGPGNNGGDGLALARLLWEEGETPTVVLAGEEGKGSRDFLRQRAILQNLGVPLFSVIPEGPYSLVADALLGVGLSRPPEGRFAELLGQMNGFSCPKVALDIPSGVDADTGQVPGEAFRADLTVAMACGKLGSFLYPGALYGGRVLPVGIGIVPAPFQKDPETAFTYGEEDLPALLPARRPDSHKGTYGRVLVIGGSTGMAGAALFAAAAAYGTGAGLVEVYTTLENGPILQADLPEALLSTYSAYDEDQLSRLLEKADTVVIGPGLGQGETAQSILEQVLATFRGPCVVDADGLNLLAQGEQKELLLRGPGPRILTPHLGEMGRLTGEGTPSRWAFKGLEVLRAFTQAYPVTCVLKDARTWVLEKGCPPYLNLTGNNGMAKGGSGDVLAGMMGGFLAQGEPPFQAAAKGVFLHGMAGDRLAAKRGLYGLGPLELIEEIKTMGRWGKEP